MALRYEYEDSRRFCQACGLVFDERTLPLADETFYRAGLTQSQVTQLMNLHIQVTAYAFTPSNYTWKQRLALAFHFLFRSYL